MNLQNIISCYCKARETQAFYTRCLNSEELSENERELIHELIKNASQSSRMIKQYCSIDKIK
jgi:predicted transcriptional regulator